MDPSFNKSTKEDKKAAIEEKVHQGIPIGILAYDEGVPVGWCSIAPRETYRKLGGDPALKDVWSLVCFFISRDHRNQGLMAQLINETVQYARQNGAAMVEAFPVDPDSPSYHFMGYRAVFEKAGFKYMKEVGTRRMWMVLDLK
jgi:GNAT superfamily N-acetyltransferase